MNNQEIGRQAIHALLRFKQRAELADLMVELQDALSAMEFADMWPDLPTEYRQLVCQLKVLTGIANDSLEDQSTPEAA